MRTETTVVFACGHTFWPVTHPDYCELFMDDKACVLVEDINHDSDLCNDCEAGLPSSDEYDTDSDLELY